ncbi:MAG: hypothetical protein ACREPA_01120 [Candidatus Dormibacteraceae bacterium]
MATQGNAEGDELMPGERPDSPYREDAEHWVRVYDQLVRGTRALLLVEWAPGRRRSPEATVLKDRLARYRRRLSYWRRRMRG